MVCGAKNYQVGDLVPLATVGAVLPGGHEDREGQAARRRVVRDALQRPRAGALRGRQRAARSCPADVVPGTPIARALGLEDVLLEVNVTPNRPDALSHLGHRPRGGRRCWACPCAGPAPRLAEAGAPAAEAVEVRIEAPEKCARYAARVVEGVKIGPSPAWLARRLEACGVRSISNVVDATNLVLLELGHPLHAFDLDKVGGPEIVVRTARPGERITTLDGKERVLEPDDLLIADRRSGQRPGRR